MSLSYRRSLQLVRGHEEDPEIFSSIQGEGPTSGEPRAFIRLAGCNLSCVWCDTPYTWNWFGTKFVHEQDRPETPAKFDPKREVIDWTLEQAIADILELNQPGLVITGGEPMLQQDALVNLVSLLKARQPDTFIEIETNGTVAPSPELEALVDQFNCSPKTSNAQTHDKRLNRDALEQLKASGKAVFKFVCSSKADVEEVGQIVEALALDLHRVFIMPKGTTSEELDASLVEISAHAQQLGFKLTDRVHIREFGDSRGT